MNYIESEEERYICLERLEKPEDLMDEDEKVTDSVDWTIAGGYGGKF